MGQCASKKHENNKNLNCDDDEDEDDDMAGKRRSKFSVAKRRGQEKKSYVTSDGNSDGNSEEDSNNASNVIMVHDVVRKDGCEKFVIDFGGNRRRPPPLKPRLAKKNPKKNVVGRGARGSEEGTEDRM